MELVISTYLVSFVGSDKKATLLLAGLMKESTGDVP
jgi:hypothetical protein